MATMAPQAHSRWSVFFSFFILLGVFSSYLFCNPHPQLITIFNKGKHSDFGLMVYIEKGMDSDNTCLKTTFADVVHKSYCWFMQLLHVSLIELIMDPLLANYIMYVLFLTRYEMSIWLGHDQNLHGGYVELT